MLKVPLGLPIPARTTPLLDALKAPKASDIVNDNVLSLMRNIMTSSSHARSFYCLLIGRITCGQYYKNVFSRSTKICHTRNINFYSYMFNDRYAKQVEKNYCNTRFSSDGMNGHTDSVCNLLMNYSETSGKLLWGLLKPI